MGFIRQEALDQLTEADECSVNESRQRGRGEQKFKHFWAKAIDLLEAMTPSARNCPIDMQPVSYNVIASYLTSLKTEEDNYKGMST